MKRGAGQFGASFAAYSGLRRRRNDVEYPSHPDEDVDLDEAGDAIGTAASSVDAAEALLPRLGLFGG